MIVHGRFTASSVPSATVLFLIGMRINSLRDPRAIAFTTVAMPRMLRHLENNPESGMLAHHQWLGRTTMLLSYWRDLAHLQRFAAQLDAPHLPAWRRFNRRTPDTGAVGIWHETYLVGEAGHENVYVDMPAFGLGKAVGTTPVTKVTNSAARRLAVS